MTVKVGIGSAQPRQNGCPAGGSMLALKRSRKRKDFCIVLYLQLFCEFEIAFFFNYAKNIITEVCAC